MNDDPLDQALAELQNALAIIDEAELRSPEDVQLLVDAAERLNKALTAPGVFRARVKLGNAAMLTTAEVLGALAQSISAHGERSEGTTSDYRVHEFDPTGPVIDDNGNVVGRWTVTR